MESSKTVFVVTNFKNQNLLSTKQLNKLNKLNKFPEWHQQRHEKFHFNNFQLILHIYINACVCKKESIIQKGYKKNFA